MRLFIALILNLMSFNGSASEVEDFQVYKTVSAQNEVQDDAVGVYIRQCGIIQLFSNSKRESPKLNQMVAVKFKGRCLIHDWHAISK